MKIFIMLTLVVGLAACGGDSSSPFLNTVMKNGTQFTH